MLRQYGLPVASNLSVLVVEMLPTYEKFFGPSVFTQNNIAATRVNPAFGLFNLEQGMSVQYFRSAINELSASASQIQQRLEAEKQLRMEEGFISQAEKEENIRPLTEQLGTERILRTSTLVPVPEVCCTD